jgi:hypothetical protein
MERTMKKTMIVLLAALAFATRAAAEEKFQKLAGAQIRAKVAGMEMSDQVHCENSTTAAAR